MSFELTTIGQYASVQGGYAFKSQDFSSSGFRPVLKIKNVRHGHIDYSDVAYVSEDIANDCKRWETTTGDILISMTGSGPSAPESLVGRVARVWNSEPKSLINQRVGRIVLKDDNAIDKDFIFYVLSLRETQEYLVSNSTGSANQVNINAKTIESVSCPIVTFEESQEIASIFKTLDRRIRLLRETNTTLEAIAQALFKSWFVDFDPVHANAGTQAPSLPAEIQALFPSRLVESPQGLIPEGWEVGVVADLGEVICGKTPPTSKPENYGDEVPFITIPDMHGKIAVTQTVRLLSKLGADTQPKKYLRPGSICVSCIATPGLVTRVTEKSQTNQQINSIVPFEMWGDSFVLFAMQRVGALVRSGGSGGSVFHNLSKSGFEKIPVLLPSQDVIKHFDKTSSPIVEKIVANQKKIQTLAELRDTLLPRLISGQLRLPELEPAFAEVG